MKRFFEQGRLDAKWVERYCLRDNSRCVRFRMEENGEFHPDHMLPDGSLDERLR
jgi:hypothetical protein